MAAEQITPTDNLSGLPLPVAPRIERIPLRRPDIADWHHHFHPREDPRLKTVGGLALRNVRMQLVPREFHNEGPQQYHRFFDGPPIPEDEATQFGMCILACAGYIPDEGIDLMHGEPKVVVLDHNQRNILRTHKQNNFDYRYFRYGYDPIRQFFAKYILNQALEDIIPPTMTDEFLQTKDKARQIELGHEILMLASSSVTEGIARTYSQFRQSGRLHEQMPADPHMLVVYKLGNIERQEQVVIPSLADQLRIKVAA